MSDYEPKSSLGKLLQAMMWEVGGIAPQALANIHVVEALQQADRQAEASRYAGCDGCSTGDCPHSNVHDCVQAQAKTIAQDAKRIVSLEAENARLREKLTVAINSPDVPQIACLAAIRAAVGDPTGKMTQDELVRYIVGIVAERDRLREAIERIAEAATYSEFASETVPEIVIMATAALAPANVEVKP